MPCLIEAFERMKNRGLIAERAFYCECHAPDAIRSAATELRQKGKPVGGFVHFADHEGTRAVGFRLPLAVGVVGNGTVAYDTPGCLVVGDVVAECLAEGGIEFEWDRTPGAPILVVVKDSLTGPARWRPGRHVRNLRGPFCGRRERHSRWGSGLVRRNLVRLLTCPNERKILFR